MLQIITSRQTLICYQSFFSLLKKTFSLNKFNYAKSSIIIHKMIQSLNILMSIYKKQQKITLYEHFINWKRKTKFELYFDKLKNTIESQCDLCFFNKKNNIELLKSSNQKRINNLTEKINKLKEAINNLNCEIKSHEEKETKLNKTIQDLQENNMCMEGDIKKSNKTESNNNAIKANISNTINQLNQSIKSLDEEMKEKDNHILIYVQEMNEMLDMFEHKTNKYNINKEDRKSKSFVISLIEWKSPTNTLKHSFNVQPYNNCIGNNNIPNNSSNNQIQHKYFYNPNQSNQGLKINNTINTKTNPGNHGTNNISNTSRGLFINIGNNDII